MCDLKNRIFVLPNLIQPIEKDIDLTKSYLWWRGPRFLFEENQNYSKIDDCEGTRKVPPDQIPPNQTLTQTLTLTQVGTHHGEIDRGRIFRTPFRE